MIQLQLLKDSKIIRMKLNLLFYLLLFFVVGCGVTKSEDIVYGNDEFYDPLKKYTQSTDPAVWKMDCLNYEKKDHDADKPMPEVLPVQGRQQHLEDLYRSIRYPLVLDNLANKEKYYSLLKLIRMVR